MLLPILTLVASFVAATILGLLGAYLLGTVGAVLGMGLGIILAFMLIARWAGR
jgi:hypothetical protein